MSARSAYCEDSTVLTEDQKIHIGTGMCRGRVLDVERSSVRVKFAFADLGKMRVTTWAMARYMHAKLLQDLCYFTQQ